MSNFKSIYIYQEQSMPESLTANEFSTIYNVVYDVATYWASHITDEKGRSKTQYCDEMGISSIIDITGNITVAKASLSNVQYVCYYANGSYTNYQGRLRITVNDYYLEFADNIWLMVIEDIFVQLKANGIIPSDEAEIEPGVTTTDVGKFEKNSTTVPRDGCVIQGVFYEERYLYMTWDATAREESFKETKDCRQKAHVQTDFDYFLFKNEQNKLSLIKKMDFVPFCKYFISNERTMPVLFSFLSESGRGVDSRKFMEEIWFYMPGHYNNQATKTKTSDRLFSFDYVIDWSKTHFDAQAAGGTGSSTFKKAFFKSNSPITLSNGAQFWLYYPTMTIEHLAIDCSSRWRGLILDFILKATNVILIDSCKEPHNIDPYLHETAFEHTLVGAREACNYIYDHYLKPDLSGDNCIITTWNATGENGDNTYAFNFASYVSLWGYSTPATKSVSAIYVKDELYWWYVCAPYIFSKLQNIPVNAWGTGESALPFGSMALSNTLDESTVFNYILINLNLYKTHTLYKENYEFYDDYYDRENNKFWWQCNNALNTVIQKTYRLYDDPNFDVYT